MKTSIEKTSFRKVYCFECDKLVEDFDTIFFLEKEHGLPRYGAICKACLKQTNNRKIVVLSGNDVIISPKTVAKDTLNDFLTKKKTK